MKPIRYTVTHARDQQGRDLFSVTRGGRWARNMRADAQTRGYAVVAQMGRFDFTLAQWSLALDARWVPNPAAARAFASAPPKAPKTPNAGKVGNKRRGTRGGPAFAAPLPTSRELKLVALNALQDVFVMRLKEQGITQETRDAYEKYKKILSLAMGPVSNQSMQNEADLALRMATIQLVKLAF